MRSTRLLLGAICLLLALPAAAPARPHHGHGHHHAEPLVIGHRGASGYRPEHTLASYRLAAWMGADYIEPDLVSTKDGVLVARHEPEIGGTTDVADRFPERKTTKTIDGAPVTGWFTEDFDLRELKTLRAKERLPDVRPQNKKYDGKFEIPTFQEVLDLRARLSRGLHRPLGVYPETKHPTYFRSIGLPIEPGLVRALNRNGLNRPGAPVFVQSFEQDNLRALRSQLRVPLVQLLDEPQLHIAGDPSKPTYAELATPTGLQSIADYADGVGPWKNYIVPWNPDESSGAPTSFVRDAHAAGLVVHPYTFRRENQFLPLELRSSTGPIGNLKAEIQQFFALGVDGVFTDNPDIGVAARRAMRR